MLGVKFVHIVTMCIVQYFTLGTKSIRPCMFSCFGHAKQTMPFAAWWRGMTYPTPVQTLTRPRALYIIPISG